MAAYDAQVALEDIRRRQGQAREAYVRHGFGRAHVLGAAVALFIAFAGMDLPGRWSTLAAVFAAAAVLVGLIVQRRGAPVRRNPSGPELLLYAGVSAVYVAVFAGAVAGAKALELPVPHTIAATAVALVSLVAAILTRPLVGAIVRREGRRG